jgi:hypothetical protein
MSGFDASTDMGATAGADSDKALHAPSISLPKGGGAIHGMGEKFGVDSVTGTGSISVPIPLSPGRQGFGPQLSLHYDSGSGNGPFGLGWSLQQPSITRKTDKGLPLYRDAEDPMSISSRARKTLSRSRSATTTTTIRIMRSVAIVRASTVFLRASSDGPRAIPAKSIGARSRATMSQRSTVLPPTRRSLIRPIRTGSSNG